jgi:4-alpha-glucanotransferase
VGVAGPLARRGQAALAAARTEHAGEIAFWKFVQWCFDTQCASLKSYANERGVSLMGDLPIFVAHDSADCWSRPDLYQLDDAFQTTVVAGVPPDDLGPLGQRWGNPLYRWDRMADEGYAWWAARMKRALTSADVVRIDHFRGFAGYYEIPASSPDARQGRWLAGPGKPLFDAIEKALGKLPIVAEDLGYITDDVHALRDGCGFPGMKIPVRLGGDGSHSSCRTTGRGTAWLTPARTTTTPCGWWGHASPRERLRRQLPGRGEHDVHWAMIRACCNWWPASRCFRCRTLGLGSEHRMNIPACWAATGLALRLADDRRRDDARVGLITAASGRGPFELLHLPSLRSSLP